MSFQKFTNEFYIVGIVYRLRYSFVVEPLFVPYLLHNLVDEFAVFEHLVLVVRNVRVFAFGSHLHQIINFYEMALRNLRVGHVTHGPRNDLLVL